MLLVHEHLKKYDLEEVMSKFPACTFALVSELRNYSPSLESSIVAHPLRVLEVLIAPAFKLLAIKPS